MPTCTYVLATSSLAASCVAPRSKQCCATERGLTEGQTSEAQSVLSNQSCDKWRDEELPYVKRWWQPGLAVARRSRSTRSAVANESNGGALWMPVRYWAERDAVCGSADDLDGEMRCRPHEFP